MEKETKKITIEKERVRSYYEHLKDYELKLDQLMEDSSSDDWFDKLSLHAVKQITGNEDYPEWFRAIWESSNFEECCEDWEHFAEVDITENLMNMCLQQIVSEYEDLKISKK